MEIGITSYGPVGCNTGTADFFTAIAPISGWIASEVRAEASPPPPGPVLTTPPPTATSAPPASPRVTLPRMTLQIARSYTRQTLAGVFGRAFKRGSSYLASCSRTSATRFNCGVTFSYRSNDYYGNVAVFYASGAKATALWTVKYTLHWVNANCYFHSGHRRQCAVHAKRGVW